jgi:hypothetical protein
MSNAVLILGESGTGKSTSIRNLPSNETFVLNVIGKPLPFRGGLTKYKKLSSDGMEGNYYATDEAESILRVINLVNQKRLDIKYLVIDDFGYSITNSFMRKATQRGYDKYTEIGLATFTILDKINVLRDDLYCFIMMHSDIDQQGRHKPKTVGKMIDQYVNIEGKFSYVFHSLVADGDYRFLTNNDGQHMAKTPLGMFANQYIPNDLLGVAEGINNYFKEENKDE